MAQYKYRTDSPSPSNAVCCYCEREYPVSETQCPYCNTPLSYCGETQEEQYAREQAEHNRRRFELFKAVIGGYYANPAISGTWESLVDDTTQALTALEAEEAKEVKRDQ